MKVLLWLVSLPQTMWKFPERTLAQSAPDLENVARVDNDGPFKLYHVVLQGHNDEGTSMFPFGNETFLNLNTRVHCNHL